MGRRMMPVLGWTAATALLLTLGPSSADLPPDGSRMTWRGWQSWLLADPERALATSGAFLAWLLTLWLAVGFLAVLGSRCAGRTGRRSRRIACLLLPRLVRGGLETLVGVTVVLSGAAPAFAGPPGAALVAEAPIPALDRTPGGTLTLNPLPVVPRPVLAPDHPADQREVVVRSGDCLWKVVGRHLGPAASDSDIARAVPSWFRANRSVIGPDPELLLPGQRLLAPTAG
jgi:hypothetical protein